MSQLPTPCIKGDMVVVRVEEEDYLVGLKIARPIYMVRLFYLRGINFSHTLIELKSCSLYGRLLDHGKQPSWEGFL